MDLTVESLRSVGGFTGGPVKREIEWEHNGEMVSAVCWIRPMSYRITLVHGEERILHMLRECVCHKDGSPMFSTADITGIKDDGSLVMTKDEKGNLVERGPLDIPIISALIRAIEGVSTQKKAVKT